MALDGNPDETNGYNSVIKNGEVADADLIKSPIPPIGSISEFGTVSGTPTLPDGWVECDGSTLSDADSPLNGQTIPNLNTTTSYWSCPGIAFTAKNPDTDACHYDSWGDTEGGRVVSDASNLTFLAPVRLPHGAVIISVLVWGSSTGDTWRLIRNFITNASGNDSAVASAALNTTDTTITDPTVDNNSAMYWLQVQSVGSGDGINGARIIYTTSSNFIMRVK